MADLPHIAATVLLWSGVLYKLIALLRSPPNPALRAHVLALTALALAMTAFLRPVYGTFDLWFGVPNLAELIGHALIVVSAWQAQILLLLLAHPREVARNRIRRRGYLIAGTLLVMGTLFTLAPVDVEAPGEFTRRYAEAPYVVEYWATLLLYLAVVLVELVRLDWRYAGLTDRRFLRLGLRLIAGGGVLGLGYFAYWGTYLALRRLELAQLPAPVGPLGRVMLLGAVALVAVGSTLPALGPRLERSRPWRWCRNLRAYRRLEPLWRALYEATPEIALMMPPTGAVGTLAVADLDLRLYRRVIEILDGRLALRPYLRRSVSLAAEGLGRAEGLEGEQLQAVVEASCLAAAIRDKAEGRSAGEDVAVLDGGERDRDREAAWLELVAYPYAHSAVVRRVVAERQHLPARHRDGVR